MHTTIPPLADFAARLCRNVPKWTKSRSVAWRVFPRLFFDSSAEYVVRLAGSDATVLCSPNSSMERSVLCLGVYEEEESSFMTDTVQKGWTALDAGANVGIHTCRIAYLVGATGRVFAFEPNPEVRSRLEANLRLNGLKNVRVVPDGLSDSPGHARLFVNDASNPNRNSTLVADPENSKAAPITITLRRLDEFWQREAHGLPVHFVKIDIEGFEFAALRSGEKMLTTCRPIILSEFSQYYAALLGYSWPELHAWYLGLKYRLFSTRGAALSSDLAFHPRANFNYVAKPFHS